jgi:hypothetical protein
VPVEEVKMDFMQMLSGTNGGGSNDDDKEFDLDVVFGALSRPKLEGLTFGDHIRGRKLGKDYKTKSDDKPVIFVRYLTEAEKVAYNAPHNFGCPMQAADIIISYFVDKRDGEAMLFAVDSSNFERADVA